jgi:transcription elongation factor Elf1
MPILLTSLKRRKETTKCRRCEGLKKISVEVEKSWQLIDVRDSWTASVFKNIRSPSKRVDPSEEDQHRSSPKIRKLAESSVPVEAALSDASTAY